LTIFVISKTKAVSFIINHKISALLDTIYSRCNEEKLTLSKNDCRKILSKQHSDLTDDEISIYADMSENSVAFANILIGLNVCKIADFLSTYSEINGENISVISNKIRQAVNNLWAVVDTNFKALPRVLKISLLEKISDKQVSDARSCHKLCQSFLVVRRAGSYHSRSI